MAAGPSTSHLAPPAPTLPLRLALCGERHSGKSSTLRRLADALAGRGLTVGGVVQPARREQGRVVGYDLLDLADGGSVALATRRADGGGGATGCPGFVFDDGAFGWAAGRILAARRGAQLVVVDELGRLEADQGRGHLPALLAPLAGERVRCYLFGVRADRREGLAVRLGGLTREFAVPLAADAEAELLALVLGACGP